MPTKEKVRIEYMSLEKLKRWPRNPKDHHLGEISQSLARFGYVAPILIDERSKKIVAGHGRLDSLLSMKDDGQKPPGRIVSKNGSWLVPVIRGIRFSSDREAEGYLLADNRLTEVGGWHEDVLVEVLSEFAKEDSLDGLGWDADDVDEIIKGIQAEPQEAPEAQIDKADELQKKWKVKKGQIYQIGSHKLMCGDNREQKDIEKLLCENKPDLLLIDPPYGKNLIVGKKGKVGGGTKKYPTKKFDSIQGDKSKFDPRPFLSLSNEQVIWGANYFSDLLPSARCWLVWFKNHPVDRTFAGCELAWTSLDRHAKVYPVTWDGYTKEGEDGPKQHPTQKPVKLFAQILEDVTEKENLILDLFIGSGTTMVAAEQTGRVCFGMEIEPKYCSVTLQRMSDMGLKPKLMR